jgi:hypothetical protein
MFSVTESESALTTGRRIRARGRRRRRRCRWWGGRRIPIISSSVVWQQDSSWMK